MGLGDAGKRSSFNFSLKDRLCVEGIRCKGFGVLPKYVMLDPDLTIEAKTIYAYFCSFAGNGNTTFPGRDKILSDLLISKDSYYRHFRQLTDQGYISVRQETGKNATFGRNIYTLVANPKKFKEKPADSKHGLEYSRIRFSGLQAMGYGTIPKLVMLDPRLPIKAKGIYAYFCSFTGSGNNAFPKKEKILFHLGITEPTYYKHYNLLTNLNYITAVQRHISGRLGVNDYYLVDIPNEASAAKKAVFLVKKQYLKKQDTVKQDTVKQDTVKQDTNKNNLTKNNLYYEHSLNQQAALPQFPAEPEQREGLSENKLAFQVKKELCSMRKLSSSYKSDRPRMEAAIHFMTEWSTFYPSGYKDDFQQRVYNLFNEALIDMCCTDKPMTLKSSYVTCARVIDKINQLAIFENNYVDLSEFSEPAMDNFICGSKKSEIKNPLQYMKACIWDAMQTGSISAYADLHQSGL